MIKNILIIILLCFSAFTHAGKIYKYTDDEGNTHYSENKPFEDDQVAEDKGVKTIEGTRDSTKNNWKSTKKKKKKKGFSFDNFVISHPVENEEIKSVDENISVGVNLNKDLPKKYRIKFYLDGIAHGKVRSYKQLIADVKLGEHSIYAEAIEARSREVLKTTPIIKFYVK